MDYEFRLKKIDSINKESLDISYLKDLKRTYSMYEIAIMTRSSPAHILGLKDRGSLKVGCIADISIYDPKKSIDQMFREASFVFKNGDEVVRDGKILKHKKTTTQCIKTTYEKTILKEIDKWIQKYYSLDLDQFRVDEDFFKVGNFKSH